MGSAGVAEALAERVAQAHKEAGLSLPDLAEKTGIPYSTLARRMSAAPDTFLVRELEAIAKATQADLQWLMIGIGRRSRKAVA